MKLRDMGLKPGLLIKAANAAGIKMSAKRATEIINGQAFIKAEEMEVIAKLLSRTVDDLYIDLGSVVEVVCPILSIGSDELIMCLRQKCAWWDWEKQRCIVASAE